MDTGVNRLIQSLIDPSLGLTPFATGGLSPRLGRDSAVASHVDYVLDGADQLFLEVQVDQI